jgi:Lon protease-like protein
MPSDISPVLGLFPLEMVVLPGEIVPLHIFEPRYRTLISERIRDNEPFGILNGTDDDYAQIGCAMHIEGVLQKFPDGRLNIITRGYRRFRVGENIDHPQPYLCRRTVWFNDEEEDVPESIVDEVQTAFHHVAHTKDWGPNLPVDVANDGASLSWSVAIGMNLSREAKQSLLDMFSAEERLVTELRWLNALLLGESD